MGIFETLFGSRPPIPPRPRDRTRGTQPFYVERGWQLRGNTLYGWYRTRYGVFEGRIDNPFSGLAKYSIINPPDKLLNGPHSACFTQRDGNRFEVHFNSKPADLTGGILTMEHTIIEALRH